MTKTSQSRPSKDQNRKLIRRTLGLQIPTRRNQKRRRARRIKIKSKIQNQRKRAKMTKRKSQFSQTMAITTGISMTKRKSKGRKTLRQTKE